MENNFLSTIQFKDFEKWYVEPYLTRNIIISSFNCVKLGKIISPYGKAITQANYNNNIPIVDKIRFSDGLIFFRKKNETNMNVYYCEKNDLLVSKINFHQGAVALNTFGLIACTTHYQPYKIDTSSVIPEYLVLVLRSKYFIDYIESIKAKGIKNESGYDFIKAIKIPVPSLEEQQEILVNYWKKLERANELLLNKEDLTKTITESLYQGLGICTIDNNQKLETFIRFSSFSSLLEWGVDKQFNEIDKYYQLAERIFSLGQLSRYVLTAYRGKSPVYKDNSTSYILNQKCNRWNYIDSSYAKNVDAEWLSQINSDILLKEGDIIVNSTGEGTLGRASVVTKELEGWLVDSHMLVLRLNKDFIDPQFIVRQINSPFGQKQVDLLKGAQATKQTELGIENLLKMRFVIPMTENQVPNIIKQKELVDIINSLEKQVDSLEDSIISLRNQAKQEFESAIFGE